VTLTFDHLTSNLFYQLLGSHGRVSIKCEVPTAFRFQVYHRHGTGLTDGPSSTR